MTGSARIVRDRDDPATLVWIDREEAFIVRWAGAAAIERVVSDVPPRRRSTGRVRHDPTVRHGGGGIPENRVERVRKTRLDEFVRDVAGRIPPSDAVRIVGPGDVREKLGRLLRAEDRRMERIRAVDTRRANPLTEGQMVAHVRELAGDPAPRRVVG
jgi:hypothetical protein